MAYESSFFVNYYICLSLSGFWCKYSLPNIFYNKCSTEIASEATAMLRTQSLPSFNQAITQVAWKDIPSTYIICEQDNAIPLFAQEAMSARASLQVRMDSDHSPFLSAPRELAEIISKLM